MMSVLAYSLMTGLTLGIMLFASDQMEFYCKREYLYPQWALLLAGCLSLFFLSALYRTRQRAIERFLKEHEKVLLSVSLIVLFLLQLLLARSLFFFSDWDPAGILSAASFLANGEPEKISLDYFSAHPNNLIIVFLYSIILRVYGFFGEIGYYGSPSVMSIVYVQAFLFTLSGLLTYLILKKLCDRGIGYFAPFFGLLLYSILIGVSPWVIITYSDALGLIFPLLILFLSITGTPKESYPAATSDSRPREISYRQIGLWLLIGLISRFAYSIKPQAIIVLIAILLVEGAEFAGSVLRAGFRVRGFITKEGEGKPRAWKGYLSKFAALLIGFSLMGILINGILIPSMGLDLDKNKSFSVEHYFMMGLNNGTDGVYDNDDTNFTNSFETPEERKKADMEVAKLRLREYGFRGFMRHLIRKQMVNFRDGTFGWGLDGVFFAGGIEGQETVLTPRLKSFIYTDGAHFKGYATFLQAVWITILALSLGIGFFYSETGKEAARELSVISLSLIGVTVFELLFEAMARYLFIYAPFWVILGTLGYTGFIASLKGRPKSGA